MVTRGRVFSSSVGMKLLIGATGLALFLYLILHIGGNLMVFLGPDTFNQYSHTLLSNPLIIPIEVGLLLNFGIRPELRRLILTNDHKLLRTTGAPSGTPHLRLLRPRAIRVALLESVCRLA